MALANNLERVLFHNADAFVVFTGFDPRANDSGNKIGRRHLSKHGPAELRRLLYYCAQGWSTAAVLVTIARKIARAAWLVIINHLTFDPKRITKMLNANHRISARWIWLKDKLKKLLAVMALQKWDVYGWLTQTCKATLTRFHVSTFSQKTGKQI